MTTTNSSRPAVARSDHAFPWFIGLALGMAVAGGFALALALPLAAWQGWDWGTRWRPLAQAHGHLQVAGWVGLFITGMAFRLVPRFAGRPLRFASVTMPALVLLVGGLLMRAVAQPWLELPGMRAVLSVGALAELAAAALFAASIAATLWPARRQLAPAPLLMLGAAGFVAQAALGLVWLTQRTAAAPSIPADRNGILLSLQFYGFMLPFVLGVSVRALPTLFRRPPPSARRVWTLAALLAVATLLNALAPLVIGGAAGVRAGAAGSLAIGAALGGLIALTGVWRRAERLRPSARHTALLVRTAYAWLAIAAAALAYAGLVALVRGRATPPYEVDAIRHALALGVFTTLIAGMAQLMLPWLAMRRQRPNAARRETGTLWALLTGATTLRVAGSLLEGQGVGAPRYALMAWGGLLGIVAVALFAATIARAARIPPPDIILHEGTVR